MWLGENETDRVFCPDTVDAPRPYRMMPAVNLYPGVCGCLETKRPRFENDGGYLLSWLASVHPRLYPHLFSKQQGAQSREFL